MTVAKCKDCVFYEPWGYEQDGDGSCCRYPKSQNTWADYWCGEFHALSSPHGIRSGWFIFPTQVKKP